MRTKDYGPNPNRLWGEFRSAVQNRDINALSDLTMDINSYVRRKEPRDLWWVFERQCQEYCKGVLGLDLFVETFRFVPDTFRYNNYRMVRELDCFTVPRFSVEWDLSWYYEKLHRERVGLVRVAFLKAVRETSGLDIGIGKMLDEKKPYRGMSWLSVVTIEGLNYLSLINTYGQELSEPGNIELFDAGLTSLLDEMESSLTQEYKRDYVPSAGYPVGRSDRKYHFPVDVTRRFFIQFMWHLHEARPKTPRNSKPIGEVE